MTPTLGGFHANHTAFPDRHFPAEPSLSEDLSYQLRDNIIDPRTEYAPKSVEDATQAELRARAKAEEKASLERAKGKAPAMSAFAGATEGLLDDLYVAQDAQTPAYGAREDAEGFESPYPYSGGTPKAARRTNASVLRRSSTTRTENGELVYTEAGWQGELDDMTARYGEDAADLLDSLAEEHGADAARDLVEETFDGLLQAVAGLEAEGIPLVPNLFEAFLNEDSTIEEATAVTEAERERWGPPRAREKAALGA